METFLIDRAQGPNIRIDVIRGKVVNCSNDSFKFNARMNELYAGKTITFLKNDYGKRFAGVYHSVRPQAVLVPKQILAAISARISDCNGKISMLLRTTYHDTKKQEEANARIKILRGRRTDLQAEHETQILKLHKEIDRISLEHDFHVTKIHQAI